MKKKTIAVNPKGRIYNTQTDDSISMKKILSGMVLDELTKTSNCQGLAQHLNTELEAKNLLERMLLDQMTAVHQLSMFFLAKSFKESDTEAVNSANCAVKLINAFQDGALTLNKLRTGGKQTVIVKHQNVTVSEGAQAVIADEFSPVVTEGDVGEN